MKTFENLEFKTHPIGNGLMARMEFDNGYGISVVRFKLTGDPFVDICAQNSTYGSYTSNEEEWEIAVLKDGDICYSTSITDDVLGNLSDDDVTNTMKQIQKLSAVK